MWDLSERQLRFVSSNRCTSGVWQSIVTFLCRVVSEASHGLTWRSRTAGKKWISERGLFEFGAIGHCRTSGFGGKDASAELAFISRQRTELEQGCLILIVSRGINQLRCTATPFCNDGRRMIMTSFELWLCPPCTATCILPLLTVWTNIKFVSEAGTRLSMQVPV